MKDEKQFTYVQAKLLLTCADPLWWLQQNYVDKPIFLVRSDGFHAKIDPDAAAKLTKEATHNYSTEFIVRAKTPDVKRQYIQKQRRYRMQWSFHPLFCLV